MKTGHTPSRSREELWQDCTIPWFTLADVWQLRDGTRTYLGETATQLSELGLANSAAELLPAGTVVLSRTASVGFTGIMPRPMATSQDFWNWICSPELLPEFLVYQFRAMTQEFRLLTQGSTHKTIYQGVAAGMSVVVPPLEDQRAVVAYLDRETARIDELIAEQERLIACLEERRRAVVAALVGNWPMRKLSRHARIGNGSTPRREREDFWGGEVPWVNSSVVNRSVVTEPSEMVTSTAVVECHLPLVPAESILVGLTGQGRTRGLATITAIPTTINQHLAYITLTDSTWRSRYLLFALHTAYERLRYISGGGGSTKGALTCAALAAEYFPAPPAEEQVRIVAAVDEQTSKIDGLMRECRELIALLKERRSALITAAVMGKIDVRDRVVPAGDR